MPRSPNDVELRILRSLSLNPINAAQIADYLAKRSTPLKVERVVDAMKSLVYFGWVTKHGPKPNRYTITRAGELELEWAEEARLNTPITLSRDDAQIALRLLTAHANATESLEAAQICGRLRAALTPTQEAQE